VKQLWAPWRLEWVKDDKEKIKNSCPFCDLPKEKPSKDNLVIERNEYYSIFLNRYPFNNGHIMIIPRKHCSDPSELSKKEWQECSSGIQHSTEVLRKLYEPQGFNIGMNIGRAGGAGIPGHLHWHLVPRWIGDSNFMPILAETKCLPGHLESMYEELSQAFLTASQQKS